MFFLHPAEWQVPTPPSITFFTSQPFSVGWLWNFPALFYGTAVSETPDSLIMSPYVGDVMSNFVDQDHASHQIRFHSLETSVIPNASAKNRDSFRSGTVARPVHVLPDDPSGSEFFVGCLFDFRSAALVSNTTAASERLNGSGPPDRGDGDC